MFINCVFSEAGENFTQLTNDEIWTEYFDVFTWCLQCPTVGALESDYPVDEEILKAESFPQYKPPPSSTSNDNAQADNSGIGGITFVQCATGNNSQPASPQVSPVGSYKSKGN